MNKQEFLNRLSQLEWEDFEVKKASCSVPKSIWETVSSFSNTAGGWVVFGAEEVNNSFKITGVKNPAQLEQDFLNTLNGEKFNTKIFPQCERYHFEDKVVLAFYIPVSNKKPMYYNALSYTFIRSGSRDRKATEHEINAMFRDQSFGTKSSEPVPNFSPNDLNQNSINQYREYMQLANPGSHYNKLSTSDFLHKTAVLVNNQPTYAGLLFFGNGDSIDRIFIDFRIDLFEIPATSIALAKTRYTYRLPEQENLWDYFFILFERIILRLDKPFKMDSQGFAKENFPYIEALREALVNLLMHADYFSPIKSRIRIFTDRIEFLNPGSYPKPIDFFLNNDVSMPRNPVLARLFRAIKLAENAGYGFDKMIDGWKTYSPIPIEFTSDLDFSTAVFYTEKTAQESTEHASKETSKETSKEINLLSETAKQIIETLSINPSKTAKSLAAQLGITDRGVQYHLAQLKKQGFIERQGSTKSGLWIVKTNE